MASPRSPRPPNRTLGVHAKTHPRSIAWRVDYDYLNKLTPEQQAWLGQFSDQYYGGDYRNDSGTAPLTKRAAYSRKNAANRDLMTKGCRMFSDGAMSEESADSITAEPAPWLETPRYKAAVAWYRELLDRVKETPSRSLEVALQQATQTIKELSHE